MSGGLSLAMSPKTGSLYTRPNRSIRIKILQCSLAGQCVSCPVQNEVCSHERLSGCELTCEDLLNNVCCYTKRMRGDVVESECVCADNYYRDENGDCVTDVVCAYCEIDGQVRRML
jgi:hypothetical protein